MSLSTQLHGQLRSNETFISKVDYPYQFTVSISRGFDEARSCLVSVSSDAVGSSSQLTREYRLQEAKQKDYIEFFSNLALDFGTRVPRSRSDASTSHHETRYTSLLTQNLTPDIMYGYGDPGLIRVTAEQTGEDAIWYYMVVTSNDAPNSFPIIRSQCLKQWELVDFVFPAGKKPSWAADGANVSDFWAPEMHYVKGKFVICFSAREKDGTLSIGLAVSSSPYGPFIPCVEPLLRGGVIDPHILVDADDSVFLFWKEDTNDVWPTLLSRLLHRHGSVIPTLFPLQEDQRTASLLATISPWIETLGLMERFFAQQVLIEAVTSNFVDFRNRLSLLQSKQTDSSLRDDIDAILCALQTKVYAQRLSLDNSSLFGDRCTVLENDQEWEGHLVEGIWVEKFAGRYYLFYSGNDFSTPQYGIGVAVAASPTGPYKKMRAPLLRSSAEWSGPGHPSIAYGPDGKPKMFLHAYVPGTVGYKEFRALLMIEIAFKDDRVVLQRSRG